MVKGTCESFIHVLGKKGVVSPFFLSNRLVLMLSKNNFAEYIKKNNDVLFRRLKNQLVARLRLLLYDYDGDEITSFVSFQIRTVISS